VQLAAATLTARVTWLGGGFHALRMQDDEPAVAVGDAVAVDGTPGVVLDPDAPRRGTSNDRLVRLTGVLRALGAS
jgi:hypothetical protein